MDGSVHRFPDSDHVESIGVGEESSEASCGRVCKPPLLPHPFEVSLLQGDIKHAASSETANHPVECYLELRRGQVQQGGARPHAIELFAPVDLIERQMQDLETGSLGRESRDLG